MNNENELASNRWNHRISLPNGIAVSTVGEKKNKNTTNSRRNKSLHGVQTFHRRQHLKPINCVNNSFTRTSLNNIKRASRISEIDLASILEQTLSNKTNSKFESRGSNTSIDDAMHSSTNGQIDSR